MATPDPSTLTSSADIFTSTHTLPQIRTIHRSILNAVDDKAQRLRTQVGSSYRELLGTADTIVRMRDDNEKVQELLSHMGAQCGRGIVGGKVSGLATFVKKEAHNQEEERLIRVSMLNACAMVLERVLKGGGGLEDSVSRGERLVLAAKVLVLCRLLVKSLGDVAANPGMHHDIEALKKSFGALRRRLLRHIEKLLGRVTQDSDREDVTMALCAYSLATSSGARDAVRHFLHVRGEAMAAAVEADHPTSGDRSEHVMQSLRLYTRTLLDVQAVVPAKLSQALQGLKAKPLLADPALKQLHGLRLDLYERWCGEEIQYFTPFIRHDDLDRTIARDTLAKWADKGGQVLLTGLKTALSSMHEFKSVMELRTNLLQLWIREGGKARGFDPCEMQDDFREVINGRMLAVLESKVKKLNLVGSEVRATLETWQDGFTDKNRGLWEEEGYDTALQQGAAPFVEEVVARVYGRNDAVSKASNCYKSWFHVIDDVKQVVESLTKQRWDNDFDEVEDEETIEARQQALSRDDPLMLQTKLDSTLDKSFEELEIQLKSLWAENAPPSNRGPVAMYFLRVLRDIRRQLPDRPATKSFGLAMVPPLHQQISIHVVTAPLRQFGEAGLSERSVAGRPLWEGEPPIPNQPSPALFQFLRNLSTDMGSAGMDLWSPAAVKVVKQHLDEKLSQCWKVELGTIEIEDSDQDEQQDENETEVKEGTSGAQRELLIQWLFDVSYARTCLGSDWKAMEDLEEAMFKATGLEEQSRTRISKGADAFWQRTSLLFGLLS
ncbi:Conserved oligomeric Golgi complex subunit-like protein [Emericellopsis cladophorae]|uniref:Conserved oligomeric Golgi complex subunit 1 n=1 Tax=Emericellopsis cladophorae TaxID=2686198 RepID=A0A9Q0BB22_9HYPO|nr:Conserved oligomeric Golgi complex subunit-like protein [Emericellopsis cladophorae]KAI6778822.1 Conserved oligomeric Golgi complex subunit-like protein [Emericellopsis cladophorae]